MAYGPWGRKELDTTAQSSLRLTSIKSVMPSSHFIFCHPLLLPPIPPSIQAWAQSTCPELSAQGLVPLRWGCALPSPNAPGSWNEN